MRAPPLTGPPCRGRAQSAAPRAPRARPGACCWPARPPGLGVGCEGGAAVGGGRRSNTVRGTALSASAWRSRRPALTVRLVPAVKTRQATLLVLRATPTRPLAGASRWPCICAATRSGRPCGRCFASYGRPNDCNESSEQAIGTDGRGGGRAHLAARRSSRLRCAVRCAVDIPYRLTQHKFSSLAPPTASTVCVRPLRTGKAGCARLRLGGQRSFDLRTAAFLDFFAGGAHSSFALAEAHLQAPGALASQCAI